MKHISEKYNKLSARGESSRTFHLACSAGKDGPAAWRDRESRNFQVGVVFALILLIIVFYAVPRFHSSKLAVPKIENPIIVTPPITEYRKLIKPPVPKIPVASEDDEIPEDEELDYTIFEPPDLTEIPPPEPDEVEEVAIVPLWKLMTKPEIITKIMPTYPDVAIRTGITGTVICEIIIDQKGTIRYAAINADYTVRPEIEETLAALKDMVG